METWKPIEGYEGLYEISDLGNVASLNYRGTGTRKNLTPKVNNAGRLWVELVNHKKKKCFLIHRLVASAFIPNPNNYPQINHIDENPKNNRLENLEWCTGEQNINLWLNNHPERRREPRTRKKIYPNRVGRNKYPILQMSKEGRLVKSWGYAIEIKRELGFHPTSIWECCEGKRKTAYGYKWQYDTSNINE